MLAASLHVVGVTRKSVVTDTSHMVVIGHTVSVGSTSGTRASVNALPMHSIGQNGTDFIIAAIRVVSTFGDGCAAHGCIIGIVTLESWSTEALAKITNSVRPTFGVLTQIVSFLVIFFCANLVRIS